MRERLQKEPVATPAPEELAQPEKTVREEERERKMREMRDSGI